MGSNSLITNAEDIGRLLRLRTSLLAVKMLRSEADIPQGAKRPVKDLGYHLDLCQAFAMSRWGGETIAMLKEDMWCFEPIIGFGLGEPPREFLEGHNRFPLSAMTLEAGKKWAQSFPCLKVGEVLGIVSAPLEKSNFEPDVVIIYCDPAQLTQILLAKNCMDGEDVNCTLSGHAACVYAIVPILKHKQCLVTSPCRGDRRIAMAQHTEIIFSAPPEMITDLTKALIYLEERGEGFPWKIELKPEPKLGESYIKIGRIMGIPC